MKKSIALIILIFSLSLQNTSATHLETLVDLKGYWKFNIGDDMQWAEANFDDRDWDELYAPSTWENQGYVGYNGMAWYRKQITLPQVSKNDALYVDLGYIDDACEVFFNGKKIGQLGAFPPNFITAQNAPAIFSLPQEYLNTQGYNTLAIRVFDDFDNGGMGRGSLAIGKDLNNEFLSYDLSGKWKFSLRTDPEASRQWHTVHVPASWESQGFADYDGYAWYAKRFILPAELANETLYLSLGKIDDKDKVYINKKLVGSILDMDDTSFENRYYGDWQTYRVYQIPKGLLHTTEKNIITVLVFDAGGIGGIYEGPIGIMNEANFHRFKMASERENSQYGIPDFVKFIIDFFD